MTLYGVVIFDIVDSRKNPARDELQRTLKKNINNFNKTYRDIIPVPAEITLGDEWQVLTNQPFKLYQIVEEFQHIFWPDNISLYAGMGIGLISTTLSQDIRNIDGPCFHHARKAIEIIKDNKNRRDGSKKNRVLFSGNGEEIADIEYKTTALKESMAADNEGSIAILLNELINVIIENNEILKGKMTSNQKEIFLQYLQYGSYRKIVEKTEKKSISNISVRLNNAAVATIQRNGAVIEKLLYSYCLKRREGYNVE